MSAASRCLPRTKVSAAAGVGGEQKAMLLRIVTSTENMQQQQTWTTLTPTNRHRQFSMSAPLHLGLQFKELHCAASLWSLLSANLLWPMPAAAQNAPGTES